jgi:hypothetical protein
VAAWQQVDLLYEALYAQTLAAEPSDEGYMVYCMVNELFQYLFTLGW